MDMDNKLYLDLEMVEKVLTDFIREEVTKSGFKKVVLGLSGGIDSAIVAYLAAKALGAENVIGIMMPYKLSSKESLEDAILVAEDLKIQTIVKEITPMIDAYFATEEDESKLRMGNKMARERMSILYDYSAKENALVIGTSNKTEILLGYSTQFGDSASALNPIGDLFKTQIWELSRHMGVPEPLIKKKPSADLWEGQTDEGELGFSYFMADEILVRLVDERKDRETLISEGYLPEIIDKILNKIRFSQYKRKLPLIAKVSGRTMGRDFRYPRDWGI